MERNNKCRAFNKSNCFCGFDYDLIPNEDLKKKCCGWKWKSLAYRITLATFKLLLLIFFVVFIVFPIIFKYSYSLQRGVIFLNFVNIPPNPDYEHPEKYGLEGSRNFYVTTDEGIKLGVWQILPENLQPKDNSSTFFEEVLSNGQDVIIYNHGNAGSRVSAHRVELYQLLRKSFHVIAYDYRSYGDSTQEPPSEDGIVRDCMFMYKWIANKTKGNVFVWGHSLGTSLSIHSLSLLQKENIRPSGIILESPFNNMKAEISEFPLARYFRMLPWFQYTVVEPMQENGFIFKTDQHICNVDAPIMILHAEEDRVVPYKLGRILYEVAKKCRFEAQGKLTFHTFSASRKYGHKYICRAPELPKLIRIFVEEAVNGTKTKLNAH